ncbi:MAG: TRAP transporter substrate-binding protein [Peptococcaceae bacterium]|nr:TRAP transporter substrate-binding protein [Peptococcaceae bacterium]
MTRKALCIAIAVMFAITMLLGGCGGSAQQTSKDSGAGEADNGKIYKLTFAGFFAANSPWHTTVYQPWVEEITKNTNGRVIIEDYPGSALLPIGKIYDGTVTGTVDMGFDSLSLVDGRFPLCDLLSKPGHPFESGECASRVFQDMIDILKPAELQDAVILFTMASGPGNFHTVKPVRKLEDLAGMEIRCIGADAPCVTALGAKPVSMSHADSYDALQKGIINGSLGHNDILPAWHIAEVTNYTTITPFLYNSTFTLTINPDVWNSLPADIQEGIKKASEKIFEERSVHFMDEEATKGLEYALQEASGHEIIYLSPEEQQRWIEKVAFILDDYVEELNQKGLPGTQAKELMFELGEKYNKVHEEWLAQQEQQGK